MFTSVVAASKRHAHNMGEGAYRIWAVIISANQVNFRSSYVTDFTFLAEKGHIGYNSVPLQFSYVP